MESPKVVECVSSRGVVIEPFAVEVEALFAVVDGCGPGRYTNIQKSFGTLIFEVPNTRRGVLTISADGKTLTEKGFIRRTTTVTSGQRGGALSGEPPQVAGKTACLDEVTGIFHRQK